MLVGHMYACLLQMTLQRSDACTAAHSGSVSKVCCDSLYRIAVSASYDKTIRLWSLEGKERACLAGHCAPVMELESNDNGILASGDRSGNVKVWDTAAAECTWELRRVHKGHITAITFADASGGNTSWTGCFATGAPNNHCMSGLRLHLVTSFLKDRIHYKHMPGNLLDAF
jgi:WD40 repeat protein